MKGVTLRSSCPCTSCFKSFSFCVLAGNAQSTTITRKSCRQLLNMIQVKHTNFALLKWLNEWIYGCWWWSLLLRLGCLFRSSFKGNTLQAFLLYIKKLEVFWCICDKYVYKWNKELLKHKCIIRKHGRNLQILIESDKLVKTFVVWQYVIFIVY